MPVLSLIFWDVFIPVSGFLECCFKTQTTVDRSCHIVVSPFAFELWELTALTNNTFSLLKAHPTLCFHQCTFLDCLFWELAIEHYTLMLQWPFFMSLFYSYFQVIFKSVLTCRTDCVFFLSCHIFICSLWLCCI